jgi:ribonuclease HI
LKNSTRLWTIIGDTPRFYFRWIAGHEKIRANEEADREAKAAATKGSSPMEELPPSM